MTFHRRSVFQAAVGVFLTSAMPLPALAQGPYPSRTIKILVPFPPGTASDAGARLLADHFGQSLKQTVIVENRPGAEGMIGLKSFLDAPADGHTMAFGPGGLMTLSGLIFPKQGLRPEAELLPVRRLARVPTVLVVSPKLGASSIRQLVELSKKSSKPLTYWTGGGQGERTNLMTTVLFSAAGANVTYVNYRAANDALANIAGSDLDFAVVAYAAAKPYVDGQRVRPIAAFENARSSLAPDLESLPEAGFPGEWRESWAGLFVRAGTAQEVISRIGQSLDDFMQSAQNQARLKALGMEPMVSTHAQALAWARAEHEDFARIVKKFNIVAKQ